MKKILLLACLLPAMSLAAGEGAPPPTLQKTDAQPAASATAGDVPSLPDDPESDSRNIPEPDVVIIKRKDATIEEYRVKGQVRYIKITPVKGQAYYMYDSDGDGQVDTREDDLANPPINRWILMEW